MRKIAGGFLAVTLVLGGGVVVDARAQGTGCHAVPRASQLVTLMNAVADPTVGGIFGGERMWAAVVDRNGEICAYATSTTDPTQVWPGSQAIAKAKAYTANAFSVDALPLSTARLYTFVQPDHSLYGLNESNLFDTQALAPTGGQGGGQGRLVGGIITFGGGVPLYKNGSVVGGLGLSGDTACADHEMAKRVRTAAGLNPPGGEDADDILYTQVDGPSAFNHPTCLDTRRDGVDLNLEELPNEPPNETHKGY
ncbi:MAG: heme-binding protein [Gemmatimonadota bacterium]